MLVLVHVQCTVFYNRDEPNQHNARDLSFSFSRHKRYRTDREEEGVSREYFLFYGHQQNKLNTSTHTSNE